MVFHLHEELAKKLKRHGIHVTGDPTKEEKQRKSPE